MRDIAQKILLLDYNRFIKKMNNISLTIQNFLVVVFVSILYLSFCEKSCAYIRPVSYNPVVVAMLRQFETNGYSGNDSLLCIACITPYFPLYFHLRVCFWDLSYSSGTWYII